MLLSHLHQKPETPEPFCTETPCHSLRPFCLCILCTCVWIIATVDDNYCNILCLTCLQVQTLIDNDSNLNFCTPSPPSLLYLLSIYPMRITYILPLRPCVTSVCLQLKSSFALERAGCSTAMTMWNGYVENSMWCARWEEEWENSSAFQCHVFQSQHFFSGVHGWNFACKSYSIAYSLTNSVRSKQGVSSTISRLTQCSGGSSSSVVIFIPVLLVKSIEGNQLWPLCAYHLFFFSFLRIHLI